MSGTEVREAVDYALRRLLGGQRDHVAVRGQRVLRQAGTGHAGAVADISGVGVYGASTYGGGDVYAD